MGFSDILMKNQRTKESIAMGFIPLLLIKNINLALAKTISILIKI
jgi:hypothetical protein